MSSNLNQTDSSRPAPVGASRKRADGTGSGSDRVKPPKRATSNSSSQYGTGSDSDGVKPPKRATSNSPSHYGTGSGSDRAKLATPNSPSKTAKNQRPTPPDIPDRPAGKTWTVPELLRRATQHFYPELARKPRKPGLSKDFFDRPSTKAWLAWYDKLMYEPIRRAEAYIRKEEEKIRAEVRSRNLCWRLDAIDDEFNRIHKEIDTIVKIVMNSYGCHRYRGEWRRRHCGRKKRLEQNTLIKNDLLRARHLAKYGPARPRFSWDYYFHPEVAQTVSLRPDSPHAAPDFPAACPDPSTAPPQVEQTVSLLPDCSPGPASSTDPTAPPSASREHRAFSQPRPNSFFTAAAPPTKPTQPGPTPIPSVPYWSELPYNPPLNPLFARAMDGTTFLVPRPDPPERPEFAPYVRPKRKRKPSERQVRKLYEDFLLNDDPVPDEKATRYTDSRIFLAELTPNCWRRYGEYFYDFFKRRLPPDLGKKKRPKSNSSKSRSNSTASQLAGTTKPAPS